MPAPITVYSHVVVVGFSVAVARTIVGVVIATMSTVSLLDTHAIVGTLTVWTFVPRVSEVSREVFTLPGLV